MHGLNTTTVLGNQYQQEITGKYYNVKQRWLSLFPDGILRTNPHTSWWSLYLILLRTVKIKVSLCTWKGKQMHALEFICLFPCSSSVNAPYVHNVKQDHDLTVADLKSSETNSYHR